MFVFQQIEVCLFTTQLYNQLLAGEKQHESKTSMPVHLETSGSDPADGAPLGDYPEEPNPPSCGKH